MHTFQSVADWPCLLTTGMSDKRPLGIRNSKGLSFNTESMANKDAPRLASNRGTAYRNNQPCQKKKL